MTSSPGSSTSGVRVPGRTGLPDWRSVLATIALVGAMIVLRFSIYPDRIVPLAYGLPLLVALWHRDARLLWGMTAAFIVMLFIKLGQIAPQNSVTGPDQLLFTLMQVTNILLPAAVIHAVIRLTGRLEETVGTLARTNTELEASNEELAAREEEITQQNEELQSQAEELEQQTEELATQTEELQGLNEQLAARERTLGDLLEASIGNTDPEATLAKLGETVERLLGTRVAAAAVLEPRGTEFVVRPLLGMETDAPPIKRSRTMAEIVMTRDRAGALADTALRPDLETPAIEGGAVRSLAAAPLRVGDSVTGALEVYSTEAGEWGEHDLRVVQWLAEQCGRLWTDTRLREELESQRRFLKTVTDTSMVALFMTDAEGRCTYLNPAAERLTGFTLEELASAPLHERLRPGGEQAPAPFPDTTASGPLHDRISRKSGEVIEVVLSATPVVSEGQRTAVVIEVHDATEARRHEAEREELLDAERAARSEAERANRMKDEFVATLSHELRTPLNAIQGWAAILKKQRCANTEEAVRGVEIIERNARQQGQLIGDLLDISRITAGKIRLDVQTVDVPLVIESALDTVRPAAEAKGVRVDRVIETVDRAVMGDPNRLQQVVWNLLSNAIKFTPKGGRVQIVVARVASYVQIRVSDTGEGMDPAVLPHLFERYRQADGSTTRRHGGLGLGLAISKHLVELHGGSIDARSEGLGQGSTFTVLLPVRAASGESRDGPHPHTPSGMTLDTDVPTLDGLRILVVDDEEDARDLIGRILRDRGGVVETAESAAAALELLEARRPDLIVSDIGMPGMDGCAFIRRVRERWPETQRDLPAVALTAFARSEDRTRALLAGFQSHIAKPVEAAELVATVASLRFAVRRLREG